MSIIELIRARAENAEPITKAEYLDLVEHIEQIKDDYRRSIALAGGFNCRVRSTE